MNESSAQRAINPLLTNKPVFLSKDILSISDINMTQKILLSAICFIGDAQTATNKQYSEFMKLSEVSISRNISQLIKKGYIKTERTSVWHGFYTGRKITPQYDFIFRTLGAVIK